MPLSYSSLHAFRSIVASTINDTDIILIDSTPTLYRYCTKGQYQKHANMKGISSYPNRYGSSVAITNNGEFGLVCDPSNERTLFLSLDPIKILTRIPIEKPDVVLFSDDNFYFAIGSSTGRLKVYQTLQCTLLCEVHLPDAIVCVAFSKEGSKVAISTMDKKVHLLYIATKKIGHVFRLDDIVEAITFSADNNKILGFTRLGSTYVFNIMLKQQFLGDPLLEWPTHIASGFNDHVILLGSRSNQLLIYNNSDGVKLGTISFDFWGITSISASAEKVFIGFSDGNGLIIELHELLQEAFNAIETNNISKLSLLAAESPLLFVNQDLCRQIENAYESVLNFHPSNNDERKGYEKIVSLMIADSAIRKELMHNLYASEDIAPFMEEIFQGNAQRACAKAYKAPLLRQLREFHEVRSNCLSELMMEIKLLEIDPEKFKEYIESVPPGCSACVHSIIPSPDILEENYKKLLSCATANNYSALMEITEQYGVLRQTKVYRRLMNAGEALIDKILMMIAAGKMNEADIYASKLTRIKPFALTGNDFKNQIKAYDSFENASKTNNLIKLFALASEYPALKTTELFREQLENYKKNVLIPASLLTKRGEVSKIISLITPYSGIEYFEEKNLLLLKKVLIHEIKLYAPLREEQSLLDHYHECFGWDEAYDHVCLALDIVPNPSQKLDEIKEECKKITTFLTGEKVLRSLQEHEDTDEY
ncbi:MAG: WD40 repeat domain-containing protein [Sulfuricurvum sp.]|uniref:WD40 repeat domain-containing protein n=1 Tax=Sulfuricurvum sp. TaxID=2025608 RepID=UPI0025DC6AC9|nr:WD40 repeat domain-containing protein [Sulfuricurvum sp.]MBV5321137.1 WD40 repeat domain-containing protein [Sulfuricurvum sp.]